MHRRTQYGALSILFSFVLSACALAGGALPGRETGEAAPAVLDTPAVANTPGPDPAATPAPLATVSDCCPGNARWAPPGFVQEGRFLDVNDLWSSPSRQVFVSTLNGVFTLQGGNWVQLWDGIAGHILGQDSRGRLWVVSGEEGETVTAVGSTGNSTFGADAGWEPLPAPDYLSPQRVDPLAGEADGRVWLATGRDELRTFDPRQGRWSTLSHADLGFPDLAEEGYQGYFLSDVVISGAGRVWVGACIGMGEVLSGAGVSRLSEGVWQPIQHTTAEKACVLDMEVDAEGNAYVGAHDRILTYKPSTGNWWVMFYPGAGDPGISLVTRIDLDPSGQPWVEVMKYSHASPQGGFDYFAFDQRRGWQTLLQDQDLAPYEVVFSPGGVAHLSRGPRLYRWANLQLEEIAFTGGAETRLAVDENGNLYALLPESGYAGLWKWAGATE